MDEVYGLGTGWSAGYGLRRERERDNPDRK